MDSSPVNYLARNIAIFNVLNSNLVEFVSERLGHEIHGEIGDITYFSNNCPIIFDYINTAIESFPTTRISIDFIHTILSDIQYILDNISIPPESNSKAILATYNAQTTGIPVPLLTEILQTHNILLWVIEQPVKQSLKPFPTRSGFGNNPPNPNVKF